MSHSDDMPKRKKGISVINWMLTLLVSAIPGVNIIFFILTLIVGKARSKRTYAAAALILTGIFLVLICAAFVVFGDQIVEFAKKLNEAKA